MECTFRMRLSLPRNRSLGAGLVGLGAGLTGNAAALLADAAAAPGASVHHARVALKRTRSILRLLEKAGADWAVAPRNRLAMLAGMMSAAREAAVAAGLARRLSRGLRGREREVAALFAARQGRIFPPDADQIGQALLREARELGAAPAPALSPLQLRHLLRRSLERAGRRHQAAARRPTLEAVHEWRKAVIVLRDQTALVARRWPLTVGAAHPLLVRFARQLGRQGDLALLVRCLQRLRVRPALERARTALVSRWAMQRERATVTALRRWPRLERKLVRLLAD